MKAKSMKSIFHTQIHLGTQLPLDWQPCLKSGQVQYYNTKTQKSTLDDPKMSQEEPPSSPGHMNLELELNQPCGSMSTNNHNHDNFMINHYSSSSSNISNNQFPNNSEGLTRCPLWLASEGDQREMVTAVCKKCHMLVMTHKSSPACPNCKFMHSLDQSPPDIFNQTLRFLC
ncbi:hypothetical protein LOK49_LG08G01072 [Camellia lanceoleosa]|uniref:Uncharacterized protein n=1 Tax=Camellia lanceoleosa TaxID=1840588 RepID=A0ACC0GWN8_9ERIC|nr:hypothetical protein LOK49_LG08G01072 [Camellia lanceoleosa]